MRVKSVPRQLTPRCIIYLTMSLADALLADFDGLSDDGGSDNEVVAPQASASSSKQPADSPFGNMGPPPLPNKLVAGQKRLMDALDGGGMDDEDDEMGGDVKAGFVPEGGVRPAEELDAEDVENTDLTSVEDVNKVSKLISGKRLREVIEVS
jgi:U4/U6 small nuclear ribonucleoprotein PRP31